MKKSRSVYSYHLSGDLGIPGFIWIPEVPLAQIETINNETETDEEGYLNAFLRIEFGKLLLHKSLFI